MAKHADHEKRRDAFAAAAFRVLARKGLTGLTVREVAKEAGFTTGALVHYFPSKDELFVAASEHAARVVRPKMEQEEAEFTGIEALRQVLYEALPRTPDTRDRWSVWLVFWDRAKSNPTVGRLAHSRYTEWNARINRLLSRAQDLGEISKSADIPLLAQATTILIDGIAIQTLRTSASITAKRQKQLIDAWVDALPRTTSARSRTAEARALAKSAAE